MPDAALNVEVNRWFATAFFLALRLMAAGWAWSWLWPISPDARWPRGIPVLFHIARAAVLGFLFNLLIVLAMGMLARYTPATEWTVWVLLVAAGLVWGRKRKNTRAELAWFGPGVFILFMAFAAIMLWPRRGEWLQGGWDPGTYVNQGVVLSRTGSVYPLHDAFFAGLSEAELELFTRRLYNYTEAYPVVPVDRDTRALVPFFFPGTPAWIALLHRIGGLRAATRANDFAGVLALLAFWAFVLQATRRPAWATFSLAALLLQPLFLFHTHFPTSEIVQLTLLGGLALSMPVGGAAGILCPLFLLAAQINRFSFLPFGLLLVLLRAAGEEPDVAPGVRIRDRLLQVGALGAGLASNYLTTTITIGRLYHVVPALLGGAVILLAGVLALDTLSSRPAWRRRVAGLVRQIAWPVAWFVIVPILMLLHLRLVPAPGMTGWNLRAAVPFLGPAWVALGVLGGTWMALSYRRPSWDILLWAIFLLLSTTITFFSAEISPILPWALRRHVEFTIPLLALCAGALAGLAWDRAGGRGGLRVIALVLLFVPAAVHGRLSARACRYTEHDGFSAVLEEIAGEIRPGDLVVADHFRWGTPLRLLHGIPVINGEMWWAPGDRRRMDKALEVLARWRSQGHSIRFLTSTTNSVGLYPSPVAPVRLDWTSGPWMDREIIHSRRARSFERREKERVFQLYTWEQGR